MESKPNSELVRRYLNDAEFHYLADRIHSSRMMSGPACQQCMEMAEAQLKALAEGSNAKAAPDPLPAPMSGHQDSDSSFEQLISGVLAPQKAPEPLA